MCSSVTLLFENACTTLKLIEDPKILTLDWETHRTHRGTSWDNKNCNRSITTKKKKKTELKLIPKISLKNLEVMRLLVFPHRPVTSCPDSDRVVNSAGHWSKTTSQLGERGRDINNINNTKTRAIQKDIVGTSWRPTAVE